MNRRLPKALALAAAAALALTACSTDSAEAELGPSDEQQERVIANIDNALAQQPIVETVCPLVVDGDAEATRDAVGVQFPALAKVDADVLADRIDRVC